MSSKKTLVKNINNLEMSCIEHMAQHGINFEGPINADGFVHKFSGRGECHEKTEWYIASYELDTDSCFRLTCTYNSHHSSLKRDENYVFTSKNKNNPLEEERGELDIMQDRVAKMQRERAANALAQNKQKTSNAAIEAQGAFSRAKTSGTSSYLIRKKIRECGVIRFEKDTLTEEDILLVPLRDAVGNITTLQRIYPTKRELFGDGKKIDKKFDSGGKKKGCFHTIGELKDGIQVNIVEGFATGASVYEATKVTTVIAFDAGNINPVISNLKQKYSNLDICICGDDDWHLVQKGSKNEGKEKAMQAARKHNSKVTFPKFHGKKFDDVGAPLTDFNDLHVHLGIEEVQKQIIEVKNNEIQKTIEEQVVEELNKKHAVVHLDRTFILTEKLHPVSSVTDFILESKRSFKDFYENQNIKGSNGTIINKANIWLKDAKRRQYENIIFDPSSKGCNPLFYNIWKGFRCEPVKGDCSLYWKHLEENICSGNHEHYRYLRKWLAYIFQYPDKIHTAIVLLGTQGVGKNSFVEPLGYLFGVHFLPLSSMHELISNFNFHQKNAVLIHVNEAFWGGNRKDIGMFKSMITDDQFVIEGKGKDRVIVKNFRHFIMSSNEDWPVHIDADDRRFFVLRVSEAHKEDIEYFSALNKQLKTFGGYEALLYDFLHENLEGFDPRKIPSADAAFDIKMLSAHSQEQYIYEMLKEESFDIGNVNNTDPFVKKPWGECPSESLYNDYCAWAYKNSLIQCSSAIFGKALHRRLPGVEKTKPTFVEGRRNYYKFPDIETCRKDFQKAFKATERIWES